MSVNRRPRATAATRPRALGRWRHHAPGFTLLEVLIALAILSVCLLAIYQGYSTSLAVVTSTRKLTTAVSYARNELARWERMDPVPEVSVEQGTFPPGDPMAGYSWRREITDLQPFPSVVVRRVQLELSWPVGLSQQVYRAGIYVLPKQS